MNRTRRRAALGTTGVFAEPPGPSAPLETPHLAPRPDRQGRTAMPFWTPVAARRQLRILAAELDTTQQELMTAALNDLFVKHGKPPIA